MRNSIFRYVIFLGLAGCGHPQLQSVNSCGKGRLLLVTVNDYSESYRRIICIDSAISLSLFQCLSSGGSIVHVPITSNSNKALYIDHIETLDTAESQVKNVYQASRLHASNKLLVTAHSDRLHRQAMLYLQETQKYMPSAHTDLQQSLYLASQTVCSATYTQGSGPYRRVVLILSDMLSDPPDGNPALTPVDFCGATVLIVRHSPNISTDSLRKICSGADVHTFTTIQDAISFIKI